MAILMNESRKSARRREYQTQTKEVSKSQERNKPGENGGPPSPPAEEDDEVSPLPLVDRSRMLLWSSKLNRSGGVLKRHGGKSYWRKRFFWIETPGNESANYVLCYSGSDRGRLELEGCSVKPSGHHDCDFMLRARGGSTGDELRLRARSNTERAAWIDTLSHVIDIANQRRVTATGNKERLLQAMLTGQGSPMAQLRIDDHHNYRKQLYHNMHSKSPLSATSSRDLSYFSPEDSSDNAHISEDEDDNYSFDTSTPIPSRQASYDEDQFKYHLDSTTTFPAVVKKIHQVLIEEPPPRPPTPTKPQKRPHQNYHSDYFHYHHHTNKTYPVEELRPVALPNTLARRHVSPHHERAHRKLKARRRHVIAHPPPALSFPTLDTTKHHQHHQHQHQHNNGWHHHHYHECQAPVERYDSELSEAHCNDTMHAAPVHMIEKDDLTVSPNEGYRHEGVSSFLPAEAQDSTRALLNAGVPIQLAENEEDATRPNEEYDEDEMSCVSAISGGMKQEHALENSIAASDEESMRLGSFGDISDDEEQLDNIPARAKEVNQEIQRVTKAVFLVNSNEKEIIRLIPNSGDKDSQRDLVKGLRRHVRNLVNTAAEIQADSVKSKSVLPEDRWFAAGLRVRSLDLQSLIAKNKLEPLALTANILNGNIVLPSASELLVPTEDRKKKDDYMSSSSSASSSSSNDCADPGNDGAYNTETTSSTSVTRSSSRRSYYADFI